MRKRDLTRASWALFFKNTFNSSLCCCIAFLVSGVMSGRRLKIIDVLIDILKYATFFLGNFRTITLGKLFNLSFTQVPPRKNITECVFFCIIKNGVIKVPGTFGGRKC